MAGVEQYSAQRQGYYVAVYGALIFADDEKEAQRRIDELLIFTPFVPIITLCRQENLKKFQTLNPVNKDVYSPSNIVSALLR